MAEGAHASIAGVDISDIKDRALTYQLLLKAKKAELAPTSYNWYPYETLSNFVHLERLLTGDNRHLLGLVEGGGVVDIGGADGDLAFFLETLGFDVDMVDNGPTNCNGLQGARALKGALCSSVAIHEVDLDAQFALPRDHYSLVFLLGILYHLKNPYFTLERLASHTAYCLLSTRIAKFTPDKSLLLAHAPVAYLVDPFETNNDPTNYWMFSEAGLRRILDRTQWDVLDFIRVGNVTESDPVHADKDERAFCLLRSRSHRHYTPPTRR